MGGFLGVIYGIFGTILGISLLSCLYLMLAPCCSGWENLKEVVQSNDLTEPLTEEKF